MRTLLWFVASVLIVSACGPAANPAAPANTPMRAAKEAEVKYSIVAQGDPMVGEGVEPLTLALRGDPPDAAALAALPPEAQTQLQAELARDPAALLLVIYGGRQPGNGYTVTLESIAVSGDEWLITYKINAPEGGAAAVQTHPYLIVKLDQVDTPADHVKFQAAP